MDLPLIASEEYRGHKIEAYPDVTAQGPREEGDNLGIIAYKHRDHVLGEEKIGDPIEFLCEKLDKEVPVEKNDEKFKELEAEFFDKFYALPLYLFEHSGITISACSFSCPWDSGQVGWIYTTKERIEKEATPENKIYDTLWGEIDSFDKYIKGEIYVVSLKDEEGNIFDNIGEVQDDLLDEMFNELKAEVDDELKEREKQANNC